MKQAVLFDMDGVITDTEKYYVEALVARLAKEGIPATPDYFNDMFGSTMVYIWSKMIERYHLSGTVESYVEDVHRIRDELIQRDGLNPMSGVIELIQKCKENGMLLAVASSAPRHTICANMKKLGILDYFDTIVSGTECEHGKPAPDIYLKAAENLGVKPEQCVVIEDATNGVKAGKAAGMYTIAYAPAQAYPQDLSLADRKISEYAELME